MVDLDFSHQNQVAHITFNKPEVLNALNSEQLDLFSKALDRISDKESVRIVLVKGAGEKAFVAGADIATMKGMSVSEAETFSRKGQNVFSRLSRLNAVVIACVKGFALGGGCELALACDLIYASNQAKFGQPEVNLGLIAGFGGTQRLTRALTPQKAKEILFFGLPMSAEEALKIGLINAVFDHDTFDASLDSLVQKLLSKGPNALIRTKIAIMQGKDVSLDQALLIEQQQFALCFTNNEPREGMTAFLEKRKAKFEN